MICMRSPKVLGQGNDWCNCTNPDRCKMPQPVKTPQAEWDRRFMRLAREASTWSKDPNEGVGCVLVSPDKRQYVIGYNGVVADHPDEAHILASPSLKAKHSRHAERNALANALVPVRGWTAYVTKAPCVDCAEDLYAHGIKRVVHAPLRQDSRWYTEQRVAIGELQMLGVEVCGYALEP